MGDTVRGAARVCEERFMTCVATTYRTIHGGLQAVIAMASANVSEGDRQRLAHDPKFNCMSLFGQWRPMSRRTESVY